MFNIKKGMTSLDVAYKAGKVQVKQAPDNLNYLPVGTGMLLKSYEALATAYLKLNQSENPNTMLMDYFRNIGFAVTDLPPQMVRNELGELITLYRLP